MEKWSLDKGHSVLEFRVKHMMISNVKGFFEDFDVQVTGDPKDLASIKINVSIAVDSISTKNEPRDQHLKSADFFNSASFPKITFSSTAIEDLGKQKYALDGELNIKGQVKPVRLEVYNGGSGVDPWGHKKIGFSVSGKIQREDFGLTWNTALEAGGVMVSSDVRFEAELQFVLA